MSKACIGIDFGGTFIKFGLLDEQGHPSPIFQLPTPARDGNGAIVRTMAEGVKTLLERQGLPKTDIAGIGIGSPGLLDLRSGRVIALPNIPGMEDFPLRDKVHEAVGIPATLANDANAAAFGEYLCGAGQGAKNMVLLTLGTGLGSGIVHEGQLVQGTHALGGELGHMIVHPGGRYCVCGQLGCLEQYCSATNLAKYTIPLIREKQHDTLLRKVLDEKGTIDAADINAARRQGDRLAVDVWEEAMYYLAIGCVNVCRILDPDRIVLGGGLTKAGEDLLEPVLRYGRELNWNLCEPKTELALASLGNDAGAIGAAGVAWKSLSEGRDAQIFTMDQHNCGT